MIETPDYFKTIGKGELYSDKFNFKVNFKVFLINQDCVIYCTRDHSKIFEFEIFNTENWTLKGTTSDNRYLFATQLMLTQLNQDFIELISNNNIIIGDFFDFAADKIIYPLANLFDINFQTTVDNFKITLRSEKQSIKKI